MKRETFLGIMIFISISNFTFFTMLAEEIQSPSLFIVIFIVTLLVLQSFVDDLHNTYKSV